MQTHTDRAGKASYPPARPPALADARARVRTPALPPARPPGCLPIRRHPSHPSELPIRVASPSHRSESRAGQSMPAESYTYAIPRELTARHGIRKFGFHGTSYQFVLQVTAPTRDVTRRDPGP